MHELVEGLTGVEVIVEDFLIRGWFFDWLIGNFLFFSNFGNSFLSS